MGQKRKGPSLTEEERLWGQGFQLIIGIDEAGRGCLAGPVSCAVVAWQLNAQAADLPPGIRDSKQIPETKREELFTQIQARAHSFGVGFASSAEIDRWNIFEATTLGVARALEQAFRSLRERGILPAAEAIAFLTDGKFSLLNRARFFSSRPEFRGEFPLLASFAGKKLHEDCLVKGDALSLSIAAASILAKVSRDRRMVELHSEYPQYEFNGHKGYSTARHQELLRQHGPCIEHRRSFGPVADLVVQKSLF